MFRGSYVHSVDDKGRVIIPLRFRTNLGPNFVVTRGLNGCLFVFREDEWKAIDEGLRRQPFFDKSTLMLTRFLSGDATDTSVDSQGRIPLSSTLRAHAGIETEQEVVIMGVGNRVEIWSRPVWESYNSRLTDEEIYRAADDVGLMRAGLG